MGERELPEGWEWKRLGDITNNFDEKRIPLKAEDRKKISGDYPYYGASGIIDYVNDFLYDGDYLLIGEDGANLLARSTPIAFKASGKFWVNNHAHVIKPKQNVLLGFLEKYLNLIDFTKYVTGSAQPKITQKNLDRIEIALPPLPIQRQIVAVLEQAEAVKRQRKEADALTGELLQSVFYEMFGDSVKNERKWIVEKFGNISKINMGQSPPGESYNRDGLGIALLNGPEEFGDKYPTPKQYTDKPSKICDIGDILFCVRGATAGRMNWSDSNYCIGRGLAAIQGIPKKSDTRFLYQFLSMNYEKFQKTGRGSTFINISRADLTDLKIPLPPLALQQRFARIVANVERIRQQQVASGKEIEGLCEGLMQKAFAGELVAGESSA